MDAQAHDGQRSIEPLATAMRATAKHLLREIARRVTDTPEEARESERRAREEAQAAREDAEIARDGRTIADALRRIAARRPGEPITFDFTRIPPPAPPPPRRRTTRRRK